MTPNDVGLVMATKKEAKLLEIKEALEKTRMNAEIEDEMNAELIKVVEKMLAKERKA